MDTDCLQEEISVTPERTPVLGTSTRLSSRDDKEDAVGMDGSTRQRRGMKEAEGGGGDGGSGDALPISRIEAAKRSLEKAMNGGSVRRGTDGEEDGDFQASAEIIRLRSSSLTSSPSSSFKSSYAKSLADSYRRASIPVVVSSPKGQFYFKNDEFLSLSASPVMGVESYRERLGSLSLSVNGDTKSAPSLTSKLQSLPPILDSNEEQQETENNRKKSDSKLLPASVYEKLLDEEVFVPFEQLHRLCEEQGGSFSLKDWHKLGSIITSDGRKLVKLSDVKLLKSDEPNKTPNGHRLLVNGSEKETQQVESLLVERGQLGDRVDQLCRALGDRDDTIQRLEEDLLRIRMECQRLLVDNRSLKSRLGHQGASQPQSPVTDNSSQVSQLQQQVQLITAQLNKAEQSRHTYEAATRQLVDFLHTVNTTLNSASHLNHNPSSPTTSPASSLHSTTSTATIKTSSTIPAEADDDPPYRLGRSSTPPPEAVSSRPAHGNKSTAEAMRKAGSVWALPTHNNNHHSRKVSRAASTHCVVSAASACQDNPAAAGASSGSEKTRSHTTDFLASRARELLTSLKSLIRSDSVLKLNLEPKKSSSSASGGKNRGSSSRSTKVESTASTPSGSSADTEPATKTSIALTGPQSSEVQRKTRPTTLSLLVSREGGEKNGLTLSETDASPTGSQNLDSASTAASPVPRIGTGKTREDTLQPQTSIVNGNPQPLSLMVVADPPCNPSDQRFSSLPLRTRITRTLTDADHRLVWV